MNNKVAPSYFLKIEGYSQTRNFENQQVNFALSHVMMITAEYLPKNVNIKPDWESRNARDSSVDLFASQLSLYIAWKPDLKSMATDAMQQCWDQIFPCMLHPFQSDKSDPEKGSSGQGETNDVFKKCQYRDHY